MVRQMPPSREEVEDQAAVGAAGSDRDEGRITTGEAHIGIAGREGSHWSLDYALRSQLSADGCPS